MLFAFCKQAECSILLNTPQYGITRDSMINSNLVVMETRQALSIQNAGYLENLRILKQVMDRTQYPLAQGKDILVYFFPGTTCQHSYFFSLFW